MRNRKGDEGLQGVESIAVRAEIGLPMGTGEGIVVIGGDLRKELKGREGGRKIKP